MLQIVFKKDDQWYFEDGIQDMDLSGGLLVVTRLKHQPEVENAKWLHLCGILGRTNAKLQTIRIERIVEASPEYLAFLIATCSKAYEVELNSCLSDAVCACLMSSMMNPDGIRELSITSQNNRVNWASLHQARLLFQGVALSSSLEKLHIQFDFEDMEDAGVALGQAFERNKSLKSFGLYSRSLHSDLALETVIRAVVTSSSLEWLTINAPHSIRHGVRRLSLSALREGLCREGCSIRHLTLESIILDGDLGDDIVQRNTSLTTMKLRGRASLSCSQAVRFAKSLKSLKHLDLDFDPLSELAPLDELLLGEESTLESLKLFVEPKPEIMDEEWKRLFQKLPRIKSLKNFDLPREVFRSEACNSAFVNGLRLNTGIERINLFNLGDRTNFWAYYEDKPFVKLYCNMWHPLSLNRGGRRYLQNQPSEQPIARNIWPHVLERAWATDYVSGYDKSRYRKLRSLECDVVYWLLREKFFT